MVRIVDRGAEHPGDLVGDELLDKTALRLDDVRHRGQVIVEKPRDLTGIQAFRQGREAGDVGKQNGHFLGLAAQRRQTVLRYHAFDDGAGQVIGEDPPDIALVAVADRGAVAQQADEGETARRERIDQGDHHIMLEQDRSAGEPREGEYARRDSGAQRG